ncbi:MAG: nucleoside triphosphate pyrophosphohydrolase [Candidatus Promineifilaceae bacterium]
MAITIVGLGPGDANHLSREVWELLNSTDILYLRTEHHPVVAELPKHLEIRSFDHLYESVHDFGELYRQIASTILDYGKADQEVIYAVPGHPLVGESTVSAIISEAQAQDIEVRILPGISFIEPSLSALNIDALDGIQVFDAVQIAAFTQPPLNTDIPLLLGQVYNRFLASEVKIALMAMYPDDHEVVLIHAAGTRNQLLENLHLYEMDRSERISHLTSMFVPPMANPSSLPSFAETVAFLRGPDGCPWDQEQTRQSLRQDFLEEVAEVLEAIDADDPSEIREELGDVLYHLVMQAQIASEMGEFTLSEVIAEINAKLVRRHPHIWGDEEVEDTADVLQNWEQLKAEEKAYKDAQSSLLDNVPSMLPALARAQKIQSRVQTVGFDWPTIEGVAAKLEEELSELREAREAGRVSDELGDVLFALVNWARWLGVHAETALREANARFERRFRALELMAENRGQSLVDLGLSELDDLWEEAKILLSDLSTGNQTDTLER